MRFLNRSAAALTLLLFAAGGAFAAPPGPPPGQKTPMGPGPVRINGSMPAMRGNGGPRPGGPGPLMRPTPPGPGAMRPGGPPMGPGAVRPVPPRPNMGPGPMRPPVGPGPQLPNYRGPGWQAHPQPYYGPYRHRDRDDDDNTGKIVLGVIGGLILGGILSNAAGSSN